MHTRASSILKSSRWKFTRAVSLDYDKAIEYVCSNPLYGLMLLSLRYLTKVSISVSLDENQLALGALLAKLPRLKHIYLFEPEPEILAALNQSATLNVAEFSLGQTAENSGGYYDRYYEKLVTALGQNCRAPLKHLHFEYRVTDTACTNQMLSLLLTYFPGLESLNVGFEDAAHLRALPQFLHLKSLQLYSNPFEFEQTEWLAWVANNPNHNNNNKKPKLQAEYSSLCCLLREFSQIPIHHTSGLIELNLQNVKQNWFNLRLLASIGSLPFYTVQRLLLQCNCYSDEFVLIAKFFPHCHLIDVKQVDTSVIDLTIETTESSSLSSSSSNILPLLADGKELGELLCALPQLSSAKLNISLNQCSQLQQVLSVFKELNVVLGKVTETKDAICRSVCLPLLNLCWVNFARKHLNEIYA
jgi:phosphotransferase system HPr-like phosphotransfer protein